MPSITPSSATASTTARRPGLSTAWWCDEFTCISAAPTMRCSSVPGMMSHRMAGLVARVGLLVRQGVGHGVGDVLDQRAAERHRQQLLAAADAQHRHVARQRAAQQRQFGRGAAFLQRDGVVPGGVAVQRRIDVEGAAGDHQGVDAVEQVGGQGGQVRQRHRQAAGAGDGVGVVGAQGVPGVFRVAAGLLGIQGDADDGCFRVLMRPC